MSSAVLPAGDWIRGISIRQPWATCIVVGAKTIENRLRPWPWPGWILLHAGQQIDRPALRVPLVARTIRGRELLTGAVIGIARLTGCHQDPDGSPPCTEWAQTKEGVAPGAQRRPGARPADPGTRATRALAPPTEDLVDQALQQLPALRP